MMKSIILIFLTFMFILCNNSKKNENTKINIFIESNAICIQTDSIAKLHYLKSITVDESDLKFGDIMIYHADQTGIYFIDYTSDQYIKIDWSGKFKFIVGKRGDGPGEFNTIPLLPACF